MADHEGVEEGLVASSVGKTVRNSGNGQFRILEGRIDDIAARNLPSKLAGRVRDDEVNVCREINIVRNLIHGLRGYTPTDGALLVGEEDPVLGLQIHSVGYVSDGLTLTK